MPSFARSLTFAASSAAKAPRSRQRRTLQAFSGRGTSSCACGGGCPRCDQQLASHAAPLAGQSALSSPDRPEVVVAPKAALETPAFAANPTLVAVMNGKRYLSFGAYGEAVRLVQEALLKSEIHPPDVPGTRLAQFGIDGNFGKETKRAVEQFQDEYGLKVDGIVGQQTLYWLDETFKSYKDRPAAKAGDKLPERFPTPLDPTAQRPTQFNLTLRLTSPVRARTAPVPEIGAGAAYTATFAGPTGKVFYVQNIRRIERKTHWQRTAGCTADCEQARAFVGTAQGLDSTFPYNRLPRQVQPSSQTLRDNDSPALPANEQQNPKGDFQPGDVVTLFAHDEFRTFLAFSPTAPLFDFSQFESLGFVDWEWKGKVRFTFNGTAWTEGPVLNRIDPSPTTMNTRPELIFLGPLYTGDEVTRNLNSNHTKIDETPGDWN